MWLDLGGKGVNFNPSKPETWLESIKKENKEIALVMSIMVNPPSPKPKRKLDISVKLVKGHTVGVALKNLTSNKR